MEHVAALLLILGCADDLGQCRELGAPHTAFKTAEACEHAIEPSMRRFMSSYPQIMAKCVGVDPAHDHSDAEIIWKISPAGDLTARVKAGSDYLVAVHDRKAGAATFRY